MLCVPFGFDQPDNAARVTRLGAARTIPRHRYQANLAARELQALLSNGHYAQRATEIGQQIRADNGAKKACDALESLLKVAR